MNKDRFPHMKHNRGNGGRRADLGNRYFRSSWEANWARYLNLLIKLGEIKAWEYESETFEFEGIKRGGKFYTPDFKVTSSDGSIEFHEVKGYMDQRSATKLKRMKKYHPKVLLRLVDKKVYRDMAKMFSATLPNWEHPADRKDK